MAADNPPSNTHTLDNDGLQDIDLESQTDLAHEPEPFYEIILKTEKPTKSLLNHPWSGKGTDDDPFIVEFIRDDPRNPKHFKQWQKWTFCIIMATATLGVAMGSSAYTGGTIQIIEEFHCTEEVATLGLSLFVLGFAIGPLFWAPMSELYGRQKTFFISFGAYTAFNAGSAGAKNIQSLLILRFFAGAFGSSPMTNAGGVISDLFEANERGLAATLFSAAPSMGPIAGPIMGGFVGETVGWRWILGVVTIYTGVIWILGSLVVPETYAPILLQRRAAALSKETGKCYISALDKGRNKTPAQIFRVTLARPWQLLFHEPICLLLSIYISIVYGTLYLTFGAFPIVFEEHRGWNQGISGLAFLGIAVGMLLGLVYFWWDNNKRYARVARSSPNGFAPAEARLPPTQIASICLPIGLFWFAWTNYPSIHWIVPIIAVAPFGFGLNLLFVSIINYLIDCYVIYAASALAANAVLRSLFGFAFPLFTQQMYNRLGIHWASSIPAFLTVLCLPFPFYFYKYGEKIRRKCKYAAHAAQMLDLMRRAELEKPVSTDNPESQATDDTDGPSPPRETETNEATKPE
ncbi:hypothetical protein Plec18170_005989 [Paecilomyces lecythidis]